ncbi:Histone-lysine N-methyltransferase SETMAR [Habropoda laboriosa]|uniref:Histone-lysine N-methyltransferase SETMAR n=1 Tax=Habropoda laboriosa TaxID=597456 RepID=A0A0L7RH44_9HYME|nr:Histone-lysine N-methyltransferase SETMAR [Habropoda laboriosa]
MNAHAQKIATIKFNIGQLQGRNSFTRQRSTTHRTTNATKVGYETLPHPAYSPDLSLTDYHFFKHLDHYL